MESRSLRGVKGGKWREGGGNGGFGEMCRGLFGSPVGSSPFGIPVYLGVYLGVYFLF